jgi:adenylate cyclase
MTTILLVDDQAENLRALKADLEEREPGWTVLAATTEAEALAALSGTAVDVVITDLVLAHDESGIAVLRAAKEQDTLVMVIIITAYERRLDRYEAYELGAYDCVSKNTPGLVAAEEIAVKTRSALAHRELVHTRLRDEKKMDVLKRYFDPAVAERLHDHDDALALTERMVTIVFWDIRGFSKLCEILKAHPELISGFLREFFDTSAGIVFRYGGVLDKFLGDGLMGLFGAIESLDAEGRGDAVSAVEAARTLRTESAALVQKWQQTWALYAPAQIEIGLGCGIHTGDALVGNVGSAVREQFTALGPHVNFAARLAARAGANEILISISTQARVADNVPSERIGIISDVKNIAGDFQIYSVR